MYGCSWKIALKNEYLIFICIEKNEKGNAIFFSRFYRKNGAMKASFKTWSLCWKNWSMTSKPENFAIERRLLDSSYDFK